MMDLSRHPWANDGVRMPRAVLARIEAHAIEAYALGPGREGEEACGVVSGPADDPLLADADERVPNLANRYHQMDPAGYPRTGRTYFLVDPLKFSRKVEAAEAAGRPVKVLYHSHLDCGAYFSPTDAETALAGGTEPSYDLAFLVVSVRGDGQGGDARCDDRKLFVFRDGAFVEAPLVLF